MAGQHVQVIASGALASRVALVTSDEVICADGGVAVALAAQRQVDLVVGDLDSAPPGDIELVVAAGAEIERHPPGKDESDLELALGAAMARGAAAITVHLAPGGRLDHQLANLAVLASPRWRSAAVDAWVGDDRVWAVWDHVELPVGIGSAIAIQAMGGVARVTTGGLRYPLADEDLDPTEARGIANVVESVPVSVRVEAGVVLVVAGEDQSAHAV